MITFVHVECKLDCDLSDGQVPAMRVLPGEAIMAGLSDGQTPAMMGKGRKTKKKKGRNDMKRKKKDFKDEANRLVEGFSDTSEEANCVVGASALPQFSGMILKKGTYKLVKSETVEGGEMRKQGTVVTNIVFPCSDPVGIGCCSNNEEVRARQKELNCEEVTVRNHVNNHEIILNSNVPNGELSANPDGNMGGRAVQVMDDGGSTMRAEGSSQSLVQSRSQGYENKGAYPKNQVGGLTSNVGSSDFNGRGVSQLYQADYRCQAIVLMDTSNSVNFENKKMRNGLFLFDKIRKLNVSGMDNILAIGKSLYKVFFDSIENANKSVSNCNKDKFVPTLSIKIGFDGNEIPDSIKIFCVNFRVNNFLPRAKQCFNCGKLGHTKLSEIEKLLNLLVEKFNIEADEPILKVLYYAIMESVNDRLRFNSKIDGDQSNAA
ncbi:PREDICTED: uncharacterized protein LOC108363630 isoform X4 [Rhagoletis zephyria]|uniref:uncharacterized protein LOC108363630 isoform X3 n=1 Tax=Rhagoletis zephyria TaxID=28612 RepID=UPI000811640B|nr:PREDICTED: uncharacterized protein LOC108363630 isoform X3 [Rhagoletis zephyria]XP_017472542.1 PREDICTED: uncharacterized protein LOC108363630 isoform X4 [Rhagoletis zephyria]